MDVGQDNIRPLGNLCYIVHLLLVSAALALAKRIMDRMGGRTGAKRSNSYWISSGYCIAPICFIRSAQGHDNNMS